MGISTRGKLTNLDKCLGFTALSCASEEGHLDIVEALLAAGDLADSSFGPLVMVTWR